RVSGTCAFNDGAQIFIGLLLILSVSFVSQTLDMKLLSWMLKTVSDIWVIALIILFQPELRRILLLIGRNGVLTPLQRYDINRAIDEILEATAELALRRFGALMVVTRTTDISMTFDTGVPIDSMLSKEMLVSIFNPKSPLHDGAVVIAGEQIRSARVVLPLSAATRIADVLLGTRHRAGLGISEQADVFVIIVSEETGSTSYAMEGKLHYNQSIDVIRLRLMEALEVTVNRKDRRLIRAIAGKFRQNQKESTERRAPRPNRAAGKRNSQ
ncbi:MAG: diadenylate cyclase CdaA, partial [Bacteroidota bacterium]